MQISINWNLHIQFAVVLHKVCSLLYISKIDVKESQVERFQMIKQFLEKQQIFRKARRIRYVMIDVTLIPTIGTSRANVLRGGDEVYEMAFHREMPFLKP